MTYKILFTVGLLFLLTGQILLARGNEFVYNQTPIDFAHWFLLVGVVFLIPQVISFPKKIFSYIGIPLTLIGIICTIGMCVLDFIFWSFPNQEMRNEFATHITQVPSIWDTFVVIGPSSKVFNLGLLFLSLNYWNRQRIGIGIIFMANLILWHLIPIPLRLVFGYSLTLVGFSLVLFEKDPACIEEINSAKSNI